MPRRRFAVLPLLIAACGLAPGLLAAETAPPASTPAKPPAATPAPAPTNVDPALLVVALVNGQPVTLRQVEDALLKKEGSDQLQDWVQSTFGKIDWLHIPDDYVILEVGGKKLHRRELAMQLLQKGAGDAREDLINIAVVQDAILKQGIAVDQAASDAAWMCFKKEFEDSHKDQGHYLDFASYLSATQHTTEAEFRRQPGFLMFAGLRLLTLAQARKTESDATLQDWFQAHQGTWDRPEAALLDEIYLPSRKGDNDDKGRWLTTAYDIAQQISSGKKTFAAAWEIWGKSWDPDAKAGGSIGWIPRNGSRVNVESPVLPTALMVEIFQVPEAKLAKPVLLPPFEAENGILLMQVEARRAATPVALADVRDAVLVDMISHQLKERMKLVLDQLRLDAKVEYQSLPALIDQRSP